MEDVDEALNDWRLGERTISVSGERVIMDYHVLLVNQRFGMHRLSLKSLFEG